MSEKVTDIFPSIWIKFESSCDGTWSGSDNGPSTWKEFGSLTENACPGEQLSVLTSLTRESSSWILEHYRFVPVGL